MSRQVTLVGSCTIGGVLHQKGETVMMSEEDADWYAESITKTRQIAADNPIVRAFASAIMPADATADANVETEVNSNERGPDYKERIVPIDEGEATAYTSSTITNQSE